MARDKKSLGKKLKSRRRKAAPSRRSSDPKSRPARGRSGKSQQTRATKLARELGDALQRQSATAEILKVIASSRSDVRPVLESIAASANRLIGGFSTAVYRFVDGMAHLAAFTPTTPAADEILKRAFPRQTTDLPQFDRVQAGKVLEIPNVEETFEEELRQIPRARGFRSMLGVPLVNNGTVIGLITVTRAETRLFTDDHLQLLQTFADQAVIAIENASLFDAVQAKTSDLEESLQFQTASADVLRVISRSPDALQPVFDVIVQTSRELCRSQASTIFILREGKFHVVAFSGVQTELLQHMKDHPISIDQTGSALARAAREKRTIHIPNTLEDPEFVEDGPISIGGPRTTLTVPLMRDGEVIGGITLRQSYLTPYTPRQIEAIETFADQAVIAIQNARLFDEVQARTRDLSEALVYQTGSGNILRVIASSPTDVGPVLKGIVDSACELCEAYDAVVALKDGDDLRFSAHHGPIPLKFEKLPINRNWVTGRAVVDKVPIHVHDLLSPEGDQFPLTRERLQQEGHRTVLSVPMLREGESIGAIVLRRIEVHPFSEKQIVLLQTFANQAVIAIGNVRMFEQVQERTKELSLSLDNLRTAQDRLIQTEKLASLGQLTAGIAHEIKNPLNFVNNFSGLSVELVDELAEGLKAVALDDNRRAEFAELTETLRGNLQKVVQHGKRADAIVKNMLLHSRQGSGEHRRVEINALVEESLNLAYHGARAEKQGFEITLERSFDPSAGEVDLFPQEITRVLLNLISNGFYAATKRKAEANGGDYEPTLAAATKNLGNSVEIRIRDNGAGIRPEVKEKMFNPFFTTKPAGEGTGLGLSISHDIIVKQHNGSIDVDTRPGEFTEFRIVLPRGAATTVAKSGEHT